MQENNEIMDEQKIIESIVKFNNDPVVHQLQAFYNNKTVPEIFGVSRRELSHSAFLSWLFNQGSNHGMGLMPLMQLLELYMKLYIEQNKSFLSEQLQTAILTRSLTILSTDVVIEESIKARKNGRADIVIYCDISIPANTITRLCIVIENKVYATEHDKQTVTYYEYYEKKRRSNEQMLYIYLTPMSIEQEAICNTFVHITYQDLLDHVLERLVSNPNIQERTRFILTEYINSLSIPSSQTDKESHNTIKSKTIMAIGEKERELLRMFWENHSELFKYALSSRANDPNLPEDDKKEAQEIRKSFAKKDRSKFSINGKGQYGKCPLPAKVVESYIKDNPLTNIDNLKKLFPDDLQSGGFGVVRGQQDVLEKDRVRYNKIEHNGDVIYVCNQWNPTNNSKFVEYVNNYIPGITITKVE